MGVILAIKACISVKRPFTEHRNIHPFPAWFRKRHVWKVRMEIKCSEIGLVCGRFMRLELIGSTYLAMVFNLSSVALLNWRK
ncbi:protein of unknown function [Agrobacterium pusense]|uniref:Uncharacterized protein n=1 Tax=Agrobacterium pusense TaxID=648995 RepID=U4Q7V8_9HYPH|nr:protein of unknown function [Agrobacterium pusense]